MVSPAVEAVLTWNLRQWSSSEFCLTGGSAEGRGPFRLETLDLEFRVFLEQEGHLLTCSLTERKVLKAASMVHGCMLLLIVLVLIVVVVTMLRLTMMMMMMVTV